MAIRGMDIISKVVNANLGILLFIKMNAIKGASKTYPIYSLAPEGNIHTNSRINIKAVISNFSFFATLFSSVNSITEKRKMIISPP